MKEDKMFQRESQEILLGFLSSSSSSLRVKRRMETNGSIDIKAQRMRCLLALPKLAFIKMFAMSSV